MGNLLKVILRTYCRKVCTCIPLGTVVFCILAAFKCAVNVKKINATMLVTYRLSREKSGLANRKQNMLGKKRHLLISKIGPSNLERSKILIF